MHALYIRLTCFNTFSLSMEAIVSSAYSKLEYSMYMCVTTNNLSIHGCFNNYTCTWQNLRNTTVTHTDILFIFANISLQIIWFYTEAILMNS